VERIFNGAKLTDFYGKQNAFPIECFQKQLDGFVKKKVALGKDNLGTIQKRESKEFLY